MHQSQERSIMSHLIEEYVAVTAEIPFLELDKKLAASGYMSNPTAASGLELIRANVELTKADRNRGAICHAISKRIVGDAISNSALY